MYIPRWCRMFTSPHDLSPGHVDPFDLSSGWVSWSLDGWVRGRIMSHKQSLWHVNSDLLPVHGICLSINKKQEDILYIHLRFRLDMLSRGGNKQGTMRNLSNSSSGSTCPRGRNVSGGMHHWDILVRHAPDFPTKPLPPVSAKYHFQTWHIWHVSDFLFSIVSFP